MKYITTSLLICLLFVSCKNNRQAFIDEEQSGRDKVVRHIPVKENDSFTILKLPQHIYFYDSNMIAFLSGANELSFIDINNGNLKFKEEVPDKTIEEYIAENFDDNVKKNRVSNDYLASLNFPLVEKLFMKEIICSGDGLSALLGYISVPYFKSEHTIETSIKLVIGEKRNQDITFTQFNMPDVSRIDFYMQYYPIVFMSCFRDENDSIFILKKINNEFSSIAAIPFPYEIWISESNGANRSEYRHLFIWTEIDSFNKSLLFLNGSNIFDITTDSIFFSFPDNDDSTHFIKSFEVIENADRNLLALVEGTTAIPGNFDVDNYLSVYDLNGRVCLTKIFVGKNASSLLLMPNGLVVTMALLNNQVNLVGVNLNAL